MTGNPARDCNICGESDWTHLSQTTSTSDVDRGHGAGSKEVFICSYCGAEGRRYTDGPSGEVSWVGALK